MKTNFLESYFSKTEAQKRRKDVIAYLSILDHLSEKSPEVAGKIIQELKDQRRFLKLIASENFCTLTVQLAMGNLLTDKYCEGYPYHRFYSGCDNVDAIEQKGADLAKELFSAEYAYVQPHSGADANLVAFWAILTQKVQNPFLEKLSKKSPEELSIEEFENLRKSLANQTFLGLALGSGGHLTHGFRQNVSAKMMRAVCYETDPKTGLFNYDEIHKLAKKEKPLILLAGYSAYPRKINFAKMRAIADEVGAVLMVDMAHFAGLVAGKVFQGDENPVPFAHVLTTTTHKTLRGPRGGMVLAKEEFSESINKGCPLIMGGPLPHVIAAKVIAFEEALQPSFKTYSAQIVKNAVALAEELKREGINLVTNGTDNHLVLIDLSKLGLTGRIAETALREAGVTSNRNMIPRDPNGAWYTTGIRMGTPALTTLGMKEQEMKEVAKVIAKVLKNTKAAFSEKTGLPSKVKGETDPKILDEAKNSCSSLLQRFPLYPELQI